MNPCIASVLPDVKKPGRYVGGEFHEVQKDLSEVDIRIAFCFPDTYEIGMSNIGMKILYDIMNAPDNWWCERCFAPWTDMESIMKKKHIPLWALESGDPIRDFDLIAFSVGYEMSYTSLLNMLLLADVPLRSSERKGLRQMVFAGGTCMYNPEPLADFLDFAIIGEGESVNAEVVRLYETAKKENWEKIRFLREVSHIEGVYVPSLYHYTWNDNGTIASVSAMEGAPETVTKRIVSSLNTSYYPLHPIVPSTEIVHDRASVELFRGCIRGCRFCQAGFVYRPIRFKSPEVLTAQGVSLLENTGYNQLSLASLSTSDYPYLPQFINEMLDYCNPKQISLSLPSLRADSFSDELMQKIQSVRKSGLTLAPEAGTQRLRDVINKNITEEDLLTSCRVAFSGGWTGVKLYFMLGLPTETDEDVEAIADLVFRVWKCWKEHTPNRNRGVNISVSAAYFIPKPFTPFQWEPQITPEEYMRRVAILRERFRSMKSVHFHWHETELSVLEAVLARGDRRLCNVLEKAVKAGCRLDAWNECFLWNEWCNAFRDTGVDMEFYAQRERNSDEILPWEPISVGIAKSFFRKELERARAGKTTCACTENCSACGASKLNGGVCDAQNAL